jgi:hypothetical protein
MYFDIFEFARNLSSKKTLKSGHLAGQEKGELLIQVTV